ncbi:MAG TPA: hypothetical protein PKD00_11200, partial [Burkholderiales bacterium]|nr:hypothetical protein [Burkholderiales bacterium]
MIYICKQAGGSEGNSPKGVNRGNHDSSQADVTVHGKLLIWGYNCEILTDMRKPQGWEIAIINVPENTPINDEKIIEIVCNYRKKYTQPIIDYVTGKLLNSNITTLHILADDIWNNGYLNSEECPITRALRRAGKEGYKDQGTAIVNNDNKIVITDYDEQYELLQIKVQSMYAFKSQDTYAFQLKPIEPADFSI